MGGATFCAARTPFSWACANLSPASFAPADLPKQSFALASPRNFVGVRVQQSARFARIVCGFAKTIDADARFLQAHVFRVFSVGPLRHLGARFFYAFSRTLLGPPTGASSARPNARTRPNLPTGWVCAPFGTG